MLNHASATQYSALAWPFAFALAACGLGLAPAGCGLDPAGSAGNGGVTSHVASNDASTEHPGSTRDAGVEDASTPATDSGSGDVGAGSDDATMPSCPGSGNGVALVAPMTTSPSFGSIGGQTFDDVCAADSVLVGITVVPSQIAPFSVSHIQALCAPIALSATCSLEMSAPIALVDHGSMAGNPQQLACPNGSAVVGIRVTSGLFIDSVAVDCAPILHDAGGTTFGRGAVTTLGPAGGTGGVPDAPFACPDGTIANELAGATSTWIQSVSIGCATPFVP